MAIPLKVLNRLRLGQDVAAVVPASRMEHRSWIYVYPIVDKRYAHRAFEGVRSTRVVSTDSRRSILCFLVRILEITEEIAEAHEKGLLDDPDDIGDPIVDFISLPKNEYELEALIKRYIDDLTQLHIPPDVNYHYENGPMLVRNMLHILSLDSQLVYSL